MLYEMGVVEAKDDAGKVIPGLFQACVWKIHWRSQTRSIERLSERRLTYGLAYVDAFIIHQKLMGATDKAVDAIQTVMA